MNAKAFELKKTEKKKKNQQTKSKYWTPNKGSRDWTYNKLLIMTKVATELHYYYYNRTHIHLFRKKKEVSLPCWLSF